MNKVIYPVILCLLLTACGSAAEAPRSNNSQTGVDAALQARMEEKNKKDNTAAGASDEQQAGESFGEAAAVGETPAGASESVEIAAAATDTGISGDGQLAAKAMAALGTDSIDVDLTQLSSTMVYSEVSNMTMAPGDYIGKTVLMNGTCATFEDIATGQVYYACVIADATACCAQGIEFELTDDYAYPDDYPAVEEEIIVTGVFDTYQEGAYTYFTLRNARLI